MAETCLLAEAAICYPPLYDELRNVTARPTETVETVAFAAVAAASEQGASAILVLSTSGNTARLLSKYRPSVPIIAGRYLILLVVSRPDLPEFSDTERADCSSNTSSPGCVSILVSRAQGRHESPMAN
jgi:Pyruvate kinase, alpha/beta domain